MNTETPIIELRDVSRIFHQGGEELKILQDISLTIHAGEFVAIMGQSGSGKTTLMNILGCLDKPSAGSYRVKGVDVADMGPDALSTLRREVFGFVFQRYNLLSGSSARENVEMPALYASMAQGDRRDRATELLTRLGLDERLDYFPSQLSGGQQQRVSIARALMNGGAIILADEPTGALDKNSGQEVLALLEELHKAGHTVILITHDSSVATRANRVITISDGTIVSDESKQNISLMGRPAPSNAAIPDAPSSGVKSDNARISPGTALGIAVRSLKDNRFRTMLTLLGIIIGVASVVSMLALGNGSKAKVLASIDAIGSDLILVLAPGSTSRTSTKGAHIYNADLAEIQALPNVLAAVGEDSESVSVRYQEADYSTSYTATGVDKPVVANWNVAHGEFFNEHDMATSAPVAVLGQTVVNHIFLPGVNPVGSYIMIRNVPFLVIGVMEAKGASPFGGDQDDVILVPATTARLRLMGRQYYSLAMVKGLPGKDMNQLQADILQLLASRHGGVEYRVLNTSSIMEATNASQDTLTMLLASVAAISLLVGGIGVMNIMLVSVVERTREIGIRMACGARQRDIMVQFLTEALMVCLIGGLLGVVLGLTLPFIASRYGTAVEYTLAPVLLAFGCAMATGLVFGFTPARKAARLDPVVALASE